MRCPALEPRPRCSCPELYRKGSFSLSGRQYKARSCRSIALSLAVASAMALSLVTMAVPPMTSRAQSAAHKGYGITKTGLTPVYPTGFDCSPLTSLYASWKDVDGSNRSEPHSGIDGGRLGDDVLAPAGGIVRAVWEADWGWGREGALLIRHARQDLNLADGPPYYYSALYHLRYDDIRDVKVGQRIARGQSIGHVFRPGGRSFYLPEVHLEVYEVGDDDALEWLENRRGAAYWVNEDARLIDPLYLMSLHVPPGDGRSVLVQPFLPDTDYRMFRGFTYILPCTRR